MMSKTTGTGQKLLVACLIAQCFLPAYAQSTPDTAKTETKLEAKVEAKQKAPAANSVEARRQALNTLLDEQWEYGLKKSPEYASMLGDKRYNDKLSDFSQQAIDADLVTDAKFLKRLLAIDTKGFSEQEKLNKELMVRQLKSNLDGAKFRDWEMPVLQNSGIHLNSAQMVSMLSFETVKDYDDYLARLKALPLAFEQTKIQMQNGVKNKLMPPKFLLEKLSVSARISLQ